MRADIGAGGSCSVRSFRRLLLNRPGVRPHRVVWRRDLTADVFELALSREEVSFVPGENLTIFNQAGNVSRPYSISSGTTEDCLRFVIRRMPGGAVSGWLGRVESGQIVHATAPFGWFRPGGETDKPFAFLATGTGIAPFLSWVRSSQISPTWILYGVRNAADACGLPDLRASGNLHVAVSGENIPDTHHGRITSLLPKMPLTTDTHFYLCGLDAMIDDAMDYLESQGIPFQNLHREVFFHAESQ